MSSSTVTHSAAAHPPARVNVLGCEIDPLSMDALVALCREAIERREYAQHAAVNVAKLVTVRDDPRQAAILRSCELVTADGQGVVWAARLLGVPLPERVPGIDLMHRLLALAEAEGYSVFILGAREDVLFDAVRRLRRDHPRLQLAGYRDGYFTEAQIPGVCAAIRASHADIVLVAMSSPRKEYFLGEHGRELGAPFVMGVGGAIDVVAGRRRRAPASWQRLGLEWLFRLIQEPRRLAWRYVRTNTVFALLVLRALIDRLRASRS